MNIWTKGIRLKLLIMVIVPTLALSLLFGLAELGFKDLTKIITQTTSQDIPSALSLGALNSGMFTMTVNLYEANVSSNPENKKKYLNDAKEELKGIEDELVEFKKYSMSEEETKIFEKFMSQWETQRALIKEVTSLIEKGESEAAGVFLTSKYSSNMDLIDANFVSFDEIQTNSSKAMLDESHATVNKWTMILTCIGFIGVGAILLIGITSAIKLAKSLTDITGNLSDVSYKVSTAATQISKSSQEISQSATEQAAALEETASSLEEISSMILKSAENADSTSNSSATTTKKAEEGQRSMQEMLHSMNEIDSSNEAIMKQIEYSNLQMMEIINVIQEIGNKTKVINEIVFQTKLLSFNASVEAARAGENGKGFAVVAEEVGNLAAMSGSAAKDISELLSNSTTKVEGIVSEMKVKVQSLASQGKIKVTEGTRVANQCADILNEIVSNIQLVSSLAQESSLASKEQSLGVGEIKKAMKQLDIVTQQNASNNEETTSAAIELANQGQVLNSQVDMLIVTVNGQAA